MIFPILDPLSQGRPRQNLRTSSHRGPFCPTCSDYSISPTERKAKPNVYVSRETAAGSPRWQSPAAATISGSRGRKGCYLPIPVRAPSDTASKIADPAAGKPRRAMALRAPRSHFDKTSGKREVQRKHHVRNKIDMLSNALVFCLAMAGNPWYNKKGTQPVRPGAGRYDNDRRLRFLRGWFGVLPILRRRDLLPPPSRKEVMCMVTSELYQFCLVIIGIIGLVLQAKKK